MKASIRRTLTALSLAVLTFGGVLMATAGAAPASGVHLVGTATSITVGQKDFVNVEARDAGGVRDSSYTGTVTFSASCGDCFTVTPASYTFKPADQGTTTVTVVWTKAGTHSLTVTGTLATGGTASSTVTGIVVSPTAATEVKLTGVETAMTVGNTDTFNVEARNPENDTDTNYAGSVSFSASCGTGCFTVTPAAYTFVPGDGGVHVFTVKWNSTGTHSLTVTGTLAGGGTDSDTITGINVTGGTTTTSTPPTTQQPTTTSSTSTTVPPTTTSTSTTVPPTTTPPTTTPPTTTPPTTTPPTTTPPPTVPQTPSPPTACNPPTGMFSGMVWALAQQWDTFAGGNLAAVAKLLCNLGL